MITIISGTNRKDSMTLRVAGIYHRLISERTDQASLLSLHDVDVTSRSRDMEEAEERLIIPADKFVFVMPEYNGSFPGVLKMLIDNSDIKRAWWGKKAMLVGLADGRAGNLRGLDHLTNILNYLRVQVYYNKIPISRIHDEIDAEGNLLKQGTEQVIRMQIEGFMSF